MSYVLQRDVKYARGVNQIVGAGQTAYISFDNGPTYNSNPFPWITYQNTGYASSMPWPNATAAPTDRIVVPDTSPYFAGAGIGYQATANSGTTAPCYFDIYDRTADAVLLSVNQSVWAIGTTTYSNDIEPALFTDKSANLAGVKGHEICLRVRNTTNVAVTMLGGSTWLALQEVTYSTDPAMTLPVTTTPNTVPVGVIADPILDIPSGSVTLVRGGVTSTLSGNTNVLQVGDQLTTGSGVTATLTLYNGTEIMLMASTSIVLTAADAHNGDHDITITQITGEIWQRVQKIADPTNRWEIITPSSPMFVRGTAFSSAIDGSGNVKVSVMDGSVQVGA